MSLIKCPECNKEISDKSKVCVNCGYPINEKNTRCIINGISYDVSFLLDESIAIPFRAKQLHLLTNSNLKDCIDKTKIIAQTNEIPKTLYLKPKEKTENKNVIKCPICNSTDIKKISGLSKASSVAMWGIFSKKINKSFECLDCKYTW